MGENHILRALIDVGASPSAITLQCGNKVAGKSQKLP